jgi:hypothetical protein
LRQQRRKRSCHQHDTHRTRAARRVAAQAKAIKHEEAGDADDDGLRMAA